jgi:hypothetical protein
MNFNAGSSSAYTYSGNSVQSGGPAIASFVVTNTPDFNLISGLGSSGQVTGNPAVEKVPISSLPSWLQTADSARTLLNKMEAIAQFEGRRYTTASPPPDYGTTANPKFTFVNGDAELPTSGGAGLLVVTGTLNLRGSTDFDGLILVLGGGTFLRDGGGNGDALGAFAVAKFDRNTTGGPFLAPTFNSNGSGTSNTQYDPTAVEKALGLSGRNILALREY